MKVFNFLASIIFLIMLSAESHGVNIENNSYTKSDVVFVGDSLTHEGPWSTNQLCLEDYRNTAVGGHGTVATLSRVQHILSTNPKKIVIMLGINDLNWMHRRHQLNKNIDQYLNASFSPETYQGQDLRKKSFSYRYRQIIKALRSHRPRPHIIMTSVLPIDETKYRARKIPQMQGVTGWNNSFLASNGQIAKMNLVLRKIAGHHNVNFVDIHTPFADFVRAYKSRFGKTPYDHTGIHFEGHDNSSYDYSEKPHYVLLADLIRPHIKQSGYVYSFGQDSKNTGCQ